MALPLSYFKKNRILELLRALLINTTLVFSSLAISLLLAEWAIRVWMPCPDYGVGKRPALRNGLFMYDPELGWKGTPNAQSEYISKDFMVYVAHDALGYRNQSPRCFKLSTINYNQPIPLCHTSCQRRFPSQSHHQNAPGHKKASSSILFSTT
jgi:hypothetical protein